MYCGSEISVIRKKTLQKIMCIKKINIWVLKKTFQNKRYWTILISSVDEKASTSKSFMKYWKSFMEYCKILHKRFFYKVLKKNCLVHIFYLECYSHIADFEYHEIPQVVKVITSGRRPRVIIPILHKWLPLPRVVFHDTQNPPYGNNIPKKKRYEPNNFFSIPYKKIFYEVFYNTP